MSGAMKPGTGANTFATFLNPRVMSVLMQNQRLEDARVKQERTENQRKGALDTYSKGLFARTTDQQAPKMLGTQLMDGGSIAPRS